MFFQRSFKESLLFTFFSFCCSVNMISMFCLPAHWFILLHPVCFWAFSVYFSVWLLYSSALLLMFELSYFLSLCWEDTLCLSIFLPISVSIFMIITLNSFFRYIAYLCFINVFFWGFDLFFHLEHILPYPHFSWNSVFVSMYQEKQFLSVLKEWSREG